MAEKTRVRLDDDEIWEFLGRGHTGILTSLRRDGMPVSLPVWYAVLDRAVYVNGPSHTKKWRRIENDPRVAFLVETGLRWAELQAVQLNGTARFVEDADTIARVEEALDAKYAAFRTRREAMPDRVRASYGRGMRMIRIEPEGRIISWNNAKIPLAE